MQAGVPDLRERPLSGPANHVKQTFDELRKRGHQVCLLAQFEGQIWKSDDLETYERVFVRWLDRRLPRFFERAVRRIQWELRLPYAGVFESVRFAQACRQELVGFDLLYERMGWMGYGGGLACRWLRIPLILEVNGDHLSEMDMLGITPQGVQRWLSTMLTKLVAKQASRVIATGEGWRRCFIERWGVTASKVAVIENGSEVVSLLNREQLRSFQTPSQNEATTIVYVGAFEPWHGIPVLLRAFAKVLAQGTLAKLILIGAGSELDRIKRLISELNIEQNVTLTGHLALPQLAACLAEAHIGVAPYCGRVEYSGLKLLDYKAAGLAIIASGKDGQPAVLEHKRTGWIVPPCNESALSQAIIRLTTDIALRKQIGREARIEAEQLHSWQHTAKLLSEEFQRWMPSDFNHKVPVKLRRVAP